MRTGVLFTMRFAHIYIKSKLDASLFMTVARELRFLVNRPSSLFRSDKTQGAFSSGRTKRFADLASHNRIDAASRSWKSKYKRSSSEAEEWRGFSSAITCSRCHGRRSHSEQAVPGASSSSPRRRNQCALLQQGRGEASCQPPAPPCAGAVDHRRRAASLHRQACLSRASLVIYVAAWSTLQL